jgi:UDP-2,3-diacylglucosamine pyrophosphatase LpxH
VKYLAVSDTHFGRKTGDEAQFRSNVQKLVDRVHEENPDELVLVGDIIDALYSEDFEENIHRDLFFKLIDSCDDVVYVPGNHDIIYKEQGELGRAKIFYPYYIKDRIMFIHGHQFDIFHVFPFRYKDLSRVLDFVDRFWEFCPLIFEEVETAYSDRGAEEVERIKKDLVAMRARTFARVMSRVFVRMVMRGELEEMSSSTFTLLSIVMPKVFRGEPFYSQNPGVLDRKMNEYGRNWTSEDFDTICYGHIHNPLLLRGTYFSFANCGYVSDNMISYAVLDGEGHMRVEKL